jgi:hypothetical protein
MIADAATSELVRENGIEVQIEENIEAEGMTRVGAREVGSRERIRRRGTTPEDAREFESMENTEEEDIKDVTITMRRSGWGCRRERRRCTYLQEQQVDTRAQIERAE